MARRLCFEEQRSDRGVGPSLGQSWREAARLMGRHPTTAHRELRRNGGPGGYGAEAAQDASGVRAASPKAPKLAQHAELAAAVCERLAMGWSPQAIQPRSADTGPPALSSETRYGGRAMNTSGRWGLAERSLEPLARQHRRRKPLSVAWSRQNARLWASSGPWRTGPSEASGRAEPVFWEGDLVIQAAKTAPPLPP